MRYLYILGASIILSLILTPVFRWLAKKMNIVDCPQKDGRKKHGRRVAYLGGAALSTTFILVAGWFYPDFQNISLILAGLVLVVILGLVDDILGIRPWQKLIGQILVSLILVYAGVGILTFPLPWGGYLDLNTWQIDLGMFGLDFTLSVWSALFTVGWTVFLMNATNFLDGVDGLASGVSAIAFLMIFFLSTAAYVNQPLVAILAAIMLGALFGFLPYNLPKASIFLGDSGSMMLGYVLSVLSIFSGGKVATLALVMGIVIMDTVLVIWSRLRQKKRLWEADRMHLHFQLIDRGWHEWSVLMLYYVVSLGLGLSAVFLPFGWVKILIWAVFVLYFILHVYYFIYRRR